MKKLVTDQLKDRRTDPLKRCMDASNNYNYASGFPAVTRAVAKISLGLQDFVELGNLDSQRDWGHAKEYVEGWFSIKKGRRWS